MSGNRSSLYVGTVMHDRVVPKRHRFTYGVFAVRLDLDEIDALAGRLRFFSRNRFNLLGFHDRDYGAGESAPIAARVRDLLARGDLAAFGARISVLCYPRLLGFVFNPLSVYFCEDESGRLGAIIYEVSNTFHERKCYVLPVRGEGEVVAQACAKEMYVSPFTAAKGRYEFRIRPPGENVFVGVNFHDESGGVLRTHFDGARRPLTDGAILRLLLRYPLMTLKVVAAIHMEAARLWWKGVPLVERHTSPRFSFTLVESPHRDPSHVK